jgi:uncharacterized protein involved in exopolysaccharide biosynthesis
MNSTREDRKLTFVLDEKALFAPESGPEKSSDFLDTLTALALRKWFILMVTTGAAAIALIIELLLPNWYTAGTKILPPQQQQSTASALLSSLGGAVGTLASAAGKDLGIKSPNDLYVGMLKTRPVTDAIIRRFDLQKLYHDRDMTYTRKELAEHTTIASEKEGFISIEVEDKDKHRAMQMAQAYVEELQNLTKDLAVTEASQRRLFFERQLKQAKDDLAAAEVALAEAQHKSGILELDAQAKAMIDTVEKLRADIVVKQARLQALRTYATDQNAEVSIAQRELAQMQAELRDLEKKSGGQDSFEVALKDVPSAGVQYVRAQREVRYRTALFEILARQYEAARLDEAKDAPLIQVVEPVVEPDHKSSPKRLATTVASGIAGFFVACLIVALFQSWTKNVHGGFARAEQLRTLSAALLGK